MPALSVPRAEEGISHKKIKVSQAYGATRKTLRKKSFAEKWLRKNGRAFRRTSIPVSHFQFAGKLWHNSRDVLSLSLRLMWWFRRYRKKLSLTRSLPKLLFILSAPKMSRKRETNRKTFSSPTEDDTKKEKKNHEKEIFVCIIFVPSSLPFPMPCHSDSECLCRSSSYKILIKLSFMSPMTSHQIMFLLILRLPLFLLLIRF